MKKTMLIFPILIATSLIGRAIDTTWTDTVGDHDWGNASNWSTLAVPGIADKVIFPPTINAVSDYLVNMNGDRSVKEISITGAGKAQIIGPSNTLTVNGNIIGGSTPFINTKLVFTAESTV